MGVEVVIKDDAKFVYISLVQTINLLQDKQSRINDSSKYDSHTGAQD